jgi:membrane-associated phospholipid phosphatase
MYFPGMGFAYPSGVMERIGHRGRGWLVFAGLTSLVLLFLMLTAQVRNFHGIDEHILLLMREPGDPDNAIGSRRFEEFVRDISALGSQGVLFLFVFAASGFLVMRRQYHAALLLIAAAVGAYFVAAGLKEIFDRPRPSLVTPLSFHTGARSFPSGHSVMAAAVFLTLGALLSRLVKPMGHKVYFIAMAALGLPRGCKPRLPGHAPSHRRGGGMDHRNLLGRAVLGGHHRDAAARQGRTAPLTVPGAYPAAPVG